MHRYSTVFSARRSLIPLVPILACFILFFLGWPAMAISAQNEKVTELVVIASDIPHPEILSTPTNERMDVVLSDGGLAELNKVIDRYNNLQALHIVSHGSPGRFKMGTDVLHNENLADYSEQLIGWRKALKPGADLLLYGCNVARGGKGSEFIEQLSQLLQVDIAASIDLTGKGGNWILEKSTGNIETTIAFTPESLAAYPGVLKQLSVTTTTDGGTGSLRWAIDQANQSPEDDLIDLKQVSGTIKLQDSLPQIAGNMTIAGDGDDILSGANAHRVLFVNRGDVTIRDLTIADGLAMGNDGDKGAGGAAGMGGGIFINGGSVTLSSVRFVNNHAVGGQGTERLFRQATKVQTQIQADKNNFDVTRGGIVGVNGISLPNLDGIDLDKEGIRISGGNERFKANRGAIAGMNGIGIGGIGSIAFGGGGGFGGFGNGGHGGDGGVGGKEGGNGGNGGDGGNGGTGVFASFDVWGQQGIGSAAFSGGAGFGGLGNAGDGGEGGDAKAKVADGGHGGNGGDGGNGGFGGGGGSGGFGGRGGNLEIGSSDGIAGQGGFGGGDGKLGFGGGGGGFGGAIFVRAGNLILNKTAFENNTASGGEGENAGQGKGGAIFIVTENLKQQASVDAVPRVTSIKQLPVFVSNLATQADNTPTDNADVFGLIRVR